MGRETGSVVVPGTSETIEASRSRRRFASEDLPALRRPTRAIATRSERGVFVMAPSSRELDGRLERLEGLGHYLARTGRSSRRRGRYRRGGRGRVVAGPAIAAGRGPPSSRKSSLTRL